MGLSIELLVGVAVMGEGIIIPPDNLIKKTSKMSFFILVLIFFKFILSSGKNAFDFKRFLMSRGEANSGRYPCLGGVTFNLLKIN